MFKATCMAMLAAGALWAAPALSQSLYSPPEGDFQVAFPEMPTVQSKPANRSKDVAARRYVVEERGRALIVAIDDYPQGELPPAADSAVYERLLRGRAEDENGRVLDTKAARLAGRPCLEGSIETKGGALEIVRILLIGDRVWALTYAVPEDVDPAGADSAFFGSFRITKSS